MLPHRNTRMILAIATLFVSVGLLWTVFPQWFYKRLSPEQAARDRRRILAFGSIILVLGLILLGMTALK
jgi:hypothetical protein